MKTSCWKKSKKNKTAANTEYPRPPHPKKCFSLCVIRCLVWLLFLSLCLSFSALSSTRKHETATHLICRVFVVEPVALSDDDDDDARGGGERKWFILHQNVFETKLLANRSGTYIQTPERMQKTDRGSKLLTHGP